MVLVERMTREPSELVLIATVGRCHLLVELLLVERQGLVGYIVIRRRASRVAILCKNIETVAITECDAMLVRQNVFVGSVEPIRRSAAHNIVASFRLWIITLIPKRFQHLKGGRERFRKSLSVGGLCQRGDSTRHCADVLIHLSPDDVRLASTTAPDDVLVLGFKQLVHHLSRVHRDGFLIYAFILHSESLFQNLSSSK